MLSMRLFMLHHLEALFPEFFYRYRYRKFNLFEEKAFLDTPQEAHLSTFETDFGVTFGMFICFDIMFTEPSIRLVREKHVTDIVYSTAWFSELPFFAGKYKVFISLQMQQSVSLQGAVTEGRGELFLTSQLLKLVKSLAG